jgi:hypothetical protein
MSKARSRKEAEEQFWTDVEELLTRKHQHSLIRSREGVNKYRGEVKSREFGDVIYNQGEELTAKVIDRIIRDGLPTPTTQ